MSELLTMQCPNCNSRLDFNPKQQQVTCQSCHSKFDAQELEEFGLIAKGLEEDDKIGWDVKSFKDTHSETKEENGFECPSCGAQITCQDDTIATECMYCRNAVMIPKKITGILTPDLIIPFEIEKDQAKELLKKHYNGKPLLPSLFKSSSKIDEITGIYVPFWLFDCDGFGTVSFSCNRIRHYSDSNYDYTETRHYNVIRDGRISFTYLPTDASSKMDDEYMDSIEPFDYSKFKDFNSLYLSGFFANKFDVDVDDCIQRASVRVKNSTESAFRSTVRGYDTVMTKSSTVKMNQGNINYALLPIWMLNVKYQDKLYQFAINGQTGKVVGKLPVDKKKAIIYFFISFVILAIIIFFIAGVIIN